MLYKNVISCAITAGIVSLNTNGNILPSPNREVASFKSLLSFVIFDYNDTIYVEEIQAIAMSFEICITKSVSKFYAYVNVVYFYDIFSFRSHRQLRFVVENNQI